MNRLHNTPASPRFWVCLSLVLTGTCCLAQTDGEDAAAKVQAVRVRSFPTLGLKEAHIRQELSVATEISWVDVPLMEAIAILEDKHGIDIWVHMQALNDAGMPADQPVTLEVKDVALRSVLKLVLEPIGLGYTVEDEVLKITTADHLSLKQITRVYPVGDLCQDAEAAAELTQALECGLGKPQIEGVPRTFSISSRLKTLTVRDSYPVQEQIEELLSALREAQSQAQKDVGADPSPFTKSPDALPNEVPIDGLRKRI